MCALDNNKDMCRKNTYDTKVIQNVFFFFSLKTLDVEQQKKSKQNIKTFISKKRKRVIMKSENENWSSC